MQQEKKTSEEIAYAKAAQKYRDINELNNKSLNSSDYYSQNQNNYDNYGQNNQSEVVEKKVTKKKARDYTAPQNVFQGVDFNQNNNDAVKTLTRKAKKKQKFEDGSYWFGVCGQLFALGLLIAAIYVFVLEDRIIDFKAKMEEENNAPVQTVILDSETEENTEEVTE